MNGARPSFRDAILWIAENDDCEAGNAELPLVSESMVADLYGTTTDHVTWCVRHVRVRLAEGLPVRRMPRERTSRAALAAATGERT